MRGEGVSDARLRALSGQVTLHALEGREGGQQRNGASDQVKSP